jgi:hypothetical protein
VQLPQALPRLSPEAARVLLRILLHIAHQPDTLDAADAIDSPPRSHLP